MTRSMNGLAVIPAAMLLALGACSGDDEPEDPIETATDEESPSTDASEPVELDLVEAGGACTLIDSELLDAVAGEDFRFASGADTEATDDAPAQSSCAVQTADAAYPDLTMFVVGTDASAEVYEDELSDDTESVDDLGEAAYWIVHTEDTGAGPALELGWYDGGNIFEMRYTTPDGTDTEAAEDLVNGFADLGRSVNEAHAAENDDE